MNVSIFIVTYKEVTEPFDEMLYKPVLTGAVFKDNTLNYLKDDVGDNISELNKYYGEYSGEYWVWKNCHCDVVGFTHHRRWFVKDIRWNKLTKEDILDDLKEYDIILPHKIRWFRTLYENHKKFEVSNPDYDVLYDDYVKVEKVLQEFYPDYAKVYNDVMNGKRFYSNNMFICKWELADKYFTWLFDVFNKLSNEIDLSKYDSRDSRVFGFIGERLLTTFVLKNNLKIKEHELFYSERKVPILPVICARFPIIQDVEKIFYKIFK